MDYLELISEFENNQKIPYSDLLNTDEWKNRRESILKRDESCCTNCGKIQSFNHSTFNISFQTKDKLIMQSVTYQNKSIDYIKEDLGIKKIDILKSPYKENTICGISEKGHLFLIDWNQIKETQKFNLIVNKGITKLGQQLFIITKRGQQFSENTFPIPLLSKSPIMIHIHHKFYVRERLPWEYDDTALVSLCNHCHWELHKKIKIPIYTMINGELHELHYTPCNRCNGMGMFPEYKHVQNGVCFRCNGNRYEELNTTPQLS